ncbi:MAG: FAD:protein FMN transferase [Anaerolineales bacterium]
MYTLSFRAMNTEVLLALEALDGAEAGLYAAENFIQVSERRFSRFLPESELSLLNASAGNWREISLDLLDILLLTRHYHQQTQGLFDPSILPDLKRAGYDQSMERIRGQEIGAPASPRLARPAFAELEIDISARRVRLPRGMELDLGGIAKAWIIQHAAQLLSGYGPACAVSAGGDMRFIGLPAASCWQVEVEDPRNPAQTVAHFQLGPGAVATSSITKRRWQQAGQPRHHIIDPRSGEPARAEWLSATVLAPSLFDAEIYAKVLLIGGAEQAARLPAGLAFLTVDENGALNGLRYEEYFNEFNFARQ